MNTLLILALSTASGCFIGLALAKRNREREEYFRCLVELCSRIETNICFKGEKLEDVLKGTEIGSDALSRNVGDYLVYIGGGEFKSDCKLLSKEENEEVREFFARLGKSDAETELNELRRRKAMFDRRLNVAAEKNKTQSSMCVKLGSLFGLLVGILMI